MQEKNQGNFDEVIRSKVIHDNDILLQNAEAFLLLFIQNSSPISVQNIAPFLHIASLRYKILCFLYISYAFKE